MNTSADSRKGPKMTIPATPTAAQGPERASDIPKPEQPASGDPSRTTNLTPPWDLPSEEEVQAAADRAEARGQAAETADEPPPILPKNPREWLPYALAWIAAEPDPEAMKTRWSQERKLRNAIGVVQEERLPVEEQMVIRVKYLLTK